MGARSEQLLREQAALLAEIDAAFADVSRDGGMSWSESVVIDDHGSESERLEARRSDKDRHWSELVEDNAWEPGVGCGGWSFLDTIGTRYYLPAALKRSVMEGEDAGVQFALTFGGREPGNWAKTKYAIFDDRQRGCVARFLLFMIEVSRQEEWGHDMEAWRKTLESGWLPYAPKQE